MNYSQIGIRFYPLSMPGIKCSGWWMSNASNIIIWKLKTIYETIFRSPLIPLIISSLKLNFTTNCIIVSIDSHSRHHWLNSHRILFIVWHPFVRPLASQWLFICVSFSLIQCSLPIIISLEYKHYYPKQWLKRM